MNETKSKIMNIGKNGEENGVNIILNDRRMEGVETYRYLVLDILSDGGMSEEVNHRITEVKKAWGAWKMYGKRGIYLERQK